MAVLGGGGCRTRCSTSPSYTLAPWPHWSRMTDCSSGWPGSQSSPGPDCILLRFFFLVSLLCSPLNVVEEETVLIVLAWHHETVQPVSHVHVHVHGNLGHAELCVNHVVVG